MNRKSTFLFLLSVFCSGFAALSYQILWTRFFELVFGIAIYSVSIVVASFMLGLFFGSFIIYKLENKINNFLTLFRLIELCLFIIGLLFPIIVFKIIQPLYIFLSGFFNTNLLYSSKIIISIFFITLPCSFMGMTIPVAINIFKLSDDYKKNISILNSVNIAGSSLGILFTIWFFIPLFYIKYTVLLIPLFNFLAFILTFFIKSSHENMLTDKKQPSLTKTKKSHEILILSLNKLIFIYFIFSIISISFEIIITRLLVLLTGSSIYAFSSILFSFILSLSIGNFLFSKLSKRISHSFIIIEFLIFAFSILFLIIFTNNLTLCFLFIFQTTGKFFFLRQFIQILFIFLLIFPAAAISGFIFCHISYFFNTHFNNSVKSTSLAFWTNSLGAFFGSLFAGFVFINLFGLKNALFFISLLCFILCFILYLNFKKLSLIYKLPLILAGILLISTINYQWDYLMLNSHLFYQRNKIFTLSYNKVKNFYNKYNKIIYYKEGADATVLVMKNILKNSLHLLIESKPDASTSIDVKTQIYSGFLGYLYSQNKINNSAVIGLASGQTAGVISLFSNHTDIIEISKNVVNACSFFSPYNFNILNKNNKKIIIDDGRNYLLTAKKKYDVIISEPSNPAISGIANLFTDEFYKIVNTKLNKTGIFVQWLPLYSNSIHNLKISIKTFIDNFNDVHFYQISSDLILIGSNSPLFINNYNLYNLFFNKQLYPLFKFKLNILSPEKILFDFLYSKKTISPVLKNIKTINSDFLPVIEWTNPFVMFKETSKNNLLFLYSLIKNEQIIPIHYLKEQSLDNFVFFPELKLQVSKDFFLEQNLFRETGLLKKLDKKKLKINIDFNQRIICEHINKHQLKILEAKAAPEKINIALQKKLVESILQGLPDKSGSFKINNHSVILAAKKTKNEYKYIALWHCPENKFIYTYLFLSQFPDDKTFFENLDYLKCIHLNNN